MAGEAPIYSIERNDILCAAVLGIAGGLVILWVPLLVVADDVVGLLLAVVCDVEPFCG
jgi:hypothetical protein